MKLFLRGLIASGVVMVVASFVSAADTPAPPVAPTNKAPAATAPVASSPAVTAGSCGCEGGSAGKVLGGRLGGRFGGRLGGRFDGSRADHVAEAYIGANERLGAFFTRMAGPPVDVAAAPHGGFHKGGPNTQPGTLVFPQHPFVRSPRDFFMTEQP